MAIATGSSIARVELEVGFTENAAEFILQLLGAGDSEVVGCGHDIANRCRHVILASRLDNHHDFNAAGVSSEYFSGAAHIGFRVHSTAKLDRQLPREFSFGLVLCHHVVDDDRGFASSSIDFALHEQAFLGHHLLTQPAVVLGPDDAANIPVEVFEVEVGESAVSVSAGFSSL